jgi:phenylalanyl-tRNA synthetase alpha chain
MRLSVTGAFARAARASRLSYAASSPRTPSSSSLRTRGANASATGQTVRHLRLNLGNQYVPAEPNALKAADTRVETDPERKKFLDQLNGQTPNEIHQQGDLSGAKVSERPFIFDKTTNLSPSILNLIDRRLYDIPNHPLCITRKLIESVFAPPYFKNHSLADPVVTTIENFDSLGFPADHPGRSPTDTYYVDASHVLRTHSSAHQSAAFQELASTSISSGFTICADVYRRDSIDRSHFPVFHQMEGAMTFLAKHHIRNRLDRLEERKAFIDEQISKLPKHNIDIVEDTKPLDIFTNPVQPCHDDAEVALMVRSLKEHLLVLVDRVFNAATMAGVGDPATRGQPLKARWVEAYFPFTSPSFELEVFWEGEWLELLGSGIVQQPILDNAGLSSRVGWAWGLGIERLAMLLFGIPDIRLFWSEDPRFLGQFKVGTVTKYEPFSRFPACYKDVSFWLPEAQSRAESQVKSAGNSSVFTSTTSTAESSPSPAPSAAAPAGGDATKASPSPPPSSSPSSSIHENDIMELIRDIGGTLVESVVRTDEFTHPRTGRVSWCYRINYRSLERTLTNEEVNAMHTKVGEGLGRLGVELREG